MVCGSPTIRTSLPRSVLPKLPQARLEHCLCGREPVTATWFSRIMLLLGKGVFFTLTPTRGWHSPGMWALCRHFYKALSKTQLKLVVCFFYIWPLSLGSMVNKSSMNLSSLTIKDLKNFKCHSSDQADTNCWTHCAYCMIIWFWKYHFRSEKWCLSCLNSPDQKGMQIENLLRALKKVRRKNAKSSEPSTHSPS